MLMRHALLCAVFSLVATSAHAATIFDNFGPGDSYDVSDSDVTGPADLAYSFVVSGSGGDFDLDQVVLALDSVSAPENANLSLADDASGSPGTVLTSFPTIGVLNPAPGDIFTVSPDSPTTLLAGQTYWLILSPPFGVEIGWGNNNTTGVIVPAAFRLNDASAWSPFSSAAAFRVEGTEIVVPEPATAFQLALGLVALGIGGRPGWRSRQASRSRG